MGGPDIQQGLISQNNDRPEFANFRSLCGIKAREIDAAS